MSHWGDTVRKQVDAFGPLVLGVDPMMDQAPWAGCGWSSNPASYLVQYTTALLDGAQGKVGFVKFQSAYFEEFGSAGIAALARCIAIARERGFAIILDVKRGDIGSTAAAYARAYLTPGSSDLEADCITVNPFLGPDTLAPFIDCAKSYGKGVFVLVKTSNEGSGWLQDQSIGGAEVSQRIAELVSGWADETLGSSGIGAVGAVVGATYPAKAAQLRKIMPRSAILAPGLGAQGGDPEVMGALATSVAPVIISASRGIAATENRDLTLEEYVALIGTRIDSFKQQLG